MDKSYFEDEEIFSELKKFEEERKKLFINYKIRITIQTLFCVLIFVFSWFYFCNFKFSLIILILLALFTYCLGFWFYVWSNNILFKKHFIAELDYLDRLKINLTPKLLEHYENVYSYYHNNYSLDEINSYFDDTIHFVDDKIVINNNNKITVTEEGIFGGERKIQISHEIDKRINSKIIISRIGLFSITPILTTRFLLLVFITISAFGLLGFLTCLYIASFRHMAILDFIWSGLIVLMANITVFGFIYREIKDFIKKLKHNVNLEDVVFCKNYKVTAKDQIEARYILTPVFIETLNRIKSIYSAKQIHCTIHEKKLFLVITTNKNLFEIGSVYKTLLDKKVIEKFNKDIDTLVNLVECLG